MSKHKTPPVHLRNLAAKDEVMRMRRKEALQQQKEAYLRWAAANESYVFDPKRRTEVEPWWHSALAGVFLVATILMLIFGVSLWQ